MLENRWPLFQKNICIEGPGIQIWPTHIHKYEINMKIMRKEYKHMDHKVCIIPRVSQIFEIEVFMIRRRRIWETLEICLSQMFAIFTRKTRAKQ